jgi:hypothetical protein
MDVDYWLARLIIEVLSIGAFAFVMGWKCKGMTDDGKRHTRDLQDLDELARQAPRPTLEGYNSDSLGTKGDP